MKVYQLVQTLAKLVKFLEDSGMAKNEFELNTFVAPINEKLEAFEKMESLIEKSIDLEKA